MPESPPSETPAALGARLERLGRSLGEREAAHAGALALARRHAESLRAQVEAALEQFHTAAARTGAAHLRVDLSEIRAGDKHLRAVEFELTRGCHKAIVVAKSAGEITLVGPFKRGKAEGPCKTFPFAANAELGTALGDFLVTLIEEAASP